MGKERIKDMPGVTICLINQKGGVGKSSSSFHLAGHFAKSGMRVLTIDADPQGSLSQNFFGPQLVENLGPHETLAAIFDDECFFSPWDTLVVPTAFDRISTVRANHTLAEHNAPEPQHAGMKQFCLQSLIEQLTSYDIVLVDCPPTLYLCSWNAMLAADFVAIPVPPEDPGTQGLRAVHQAVDTAKLLNAKLQLLGHIVTRSDSRQAIHLAYETKLRTLYPDLVFQAVVPEATAFKLAVASRTPITHFAPRSKAANATRMLGDEMLERISVLTERRHVA